jgi:mannose-1-phosphate guanylyltransferase
MAGGVGSRFWPISRTRKPKQFLDILGTGKSLLRQTYERFINICPVENIYIVTNESYVDLVAEQLPELNRSQILGEPSRKNTAPCIAYANLKIRERNPDANIVVAPSDHLILKEEKFIDIISNCLDFASRTDSLLTLGINPTRPETGYGYIQIGDDKPEDNDFFNKVKSFTEKPDKKTAVKFLESGEFFWNSGIFIWSLKSITEAFKKYLPEINHLFSDISNIQSQEKEKTFIEETYSACQNISIDNGIMEHAENVYVHCTDIGWSDLGTWDSLYENSDKETDGNVLNSENILVYNTKNSIINISEDKLVVVEGLEDYILAESDNILMICKRDNEKKIRKFVKDVEDKKGEQYI